MMGTQTVFRKNPDIVLRRVAGQVLLIPIRGNIADMERIYILNDTAEQVWELLDGSRSIGVVARMLADMFDVSADTTVRDVEELMADLWAAGLIEKAT